MQTDYGRLEAVAASLLEQPGLSSRQQILVLSVKGIAETLATKVVAHPEDVEALRVLGGHLGETLRAVGRQGEPISPASLNPQWVALLDLCDSRLGDKKRRVRVASGSQASPSALAQKHTDDRPVTVRTRLVSELVSGLN